MGWRTLAILPLIFLGAGAAPPGDCTPGADSGQTLPTPLDLAGRPSMPPGLTAQTFAALPTAEGQAGCHTPLPSVSQATTLRSESGDILHSLPQPDILRRMDEPRRAPEFQ
jgi:hypothetical protein